jgi:putative NADPH-quinone reductase
MKQSYTIIYTHPYDKSYNHAILEVCKKALENSKINIIDLYEDNFNPIITKEELKIYNKGKYLDPLVKKYQQILEKTSNLIIITPIWWGVMPAMLKGFFEKVFLKTWAYDYEKTLPKGKLTNIKKTTLITTMNGPGFYYKLFFKSLS